MVRPVSSDRQHGAMRSSAEPKLLGALEIPERSLDLVAIGISYETAVVGLTVVRARAGLAVVGRPGRDPVRRIELAFELATGRPPNQREKELSLRFLKTEPLEEFALAMFNLNRFLYVE